jgi:hypothetical protein
MQEPRETPGGRRTCGRDDTWTNPASENKTTIKRGPGQQNLFDSTSRVHKKKTHHSEI